MLDIPEVDIEVAKTNEALRKSAAKHIRSFFQDKTYHLPDLDGDPCPVPDHILLTPDNITIVVACVELVWALDLLERSIRDHVRQGHQLMYHPIANKRDEVQYTCWLMRECHRCRVPKGFMGGMILLYTWLCEGVQFDPNGHGGS